jgi:tetratricopeptide (TPR) repeat protein
MDRVVQDVRRTASLGIWILALAGMGWARQAATPQSSSSAPASAPPAASAQTASPSPGKTPPQAKTQEEYKAYTDAEDIKDPQGLDKAANAFAAKYPSSELRYLLFYKSMLMYQSANDADHAIDMGRKVLSLNPNEPATLALVALMLAEGTGDTDANRDPRFNEAVADAEKALKTVDSEMQAQPNTTPEQVERGKKAIRFYAYSAIGTVFLAKDNYAEAEKDLKDAIDAMGDAPDAITYLRYAIALDQQKKYSDAMTATDKALALTTPGTQQATMVSQEKERLQKLTGGSAPTPK